MSPDSKALEKKLDRDFLHYLSLTKSLFDQIKSQDEKGLCEAWLKQLCGKCITTVSGKRDRNIYLSRLLLQMQDGKLKDIFLTAPPAGNLESPYTVFGLPLEVEDIKGFQEMGFQLENDAAGGSGDFSEISRDGRTYLATRQIKNGMMAYLAVTVTEDEPLWLPQQIRSTKSGIAEDESKPAVMGRFIKRLAQMKCVPLTHLRKTPEERERVLEWMDKIIEDCNKWLGAEDPHNMDLETLFELLYQNYRDDPEKAKILQYPKDVRDVLMRDIRQKITERRAQVSRRELILDQYEADEYVEERFPAEELDSIWRQCAARPLKEYNRRNLESTYPTEVVNRFFELLVQERLFIIVKRERDANKKIDEMRSSNIDDIKKELQKLKKLKEEYKEYYCIYKEAEEYETEYQNILKESGSDKGEKPVKKQDIMRLKGELEEEIESYRLRCEKERQTQGELVEKLQEAKEAFSGRRDDLKAVEERLKCEKQKLWVEKRKLSERIKAQKKRLCDLRNQMKMKQQNVAQYEE